MSVKPMNSRAGVWEHAEPKTVKNFSATILVK